MKRRITSLLAGTLAMAMLTGCAANGQNTSTSQQSQEEKGNPVLNYIGGNIAWDPNSELTNSLLQDLTGYQMEYFVLPADEPEKKLNMDLASGTEYDIVRMEPSWFDKLAAQNALLPLNDLIEQYGPNIKKYCLPELFETTTRDGKIYGIPSPTPGCGVYWGIAIRQDILDEMGLEIPTDVEQLYTCLKEIKDKKEMIPLTTSEPVLSHIASAFGLSTYFREIDGKLVAQPEQEGMPEYLKFMNKLYMEGLLDPDFPTNKAENVREKFTSGQAAALLMTYGSQTPPAIIMPALRENLPSAKLTFILPLKDENGNRQIPLDKGLENITAIPVTSEHPEDAVKWINATLDDANYDQLTIGEEGIHFKKDGDMYEPILPKFFEDKGNSWWLIPVTNHYKFPTYWEELRIKKNMDVYDVYAQLSESLEYGQTDPTTLMSFNEVTANLKQKLKQMENDYYIRVISGAEDIENYDNFLQRWRDAGGTQITEECNKWYQEQK